MDYELAKQLKDAGFTQKPEDLLTQVEYRGITYVKPTEPTLSELIEACGEKEDFALFRIGDNWSAEYKNPSWAVRLGEVEGEYIGEGKTPEEAVARLWLHLNN